MVRAKSRVFLSVDISITRDPDAYCEWTGLHFPSDQGSHSKSILTQFKHESQVTISSSLSNQILAKRLGPFVCANYNTKNE